MICPHVTPGQEACTVCQDYFNFWKMVEEMRHHQRMHATGQITETINQAKRLELLVDKKINGLKSA